MRPYREEDHDQIIRWCLERDIPIPHRWALPESGVIIDRVAVGFLILTNNHVGIFDFFITNPLASKQARDKALDEIVLNFIELATDLGLRALHCDSQHPAIKERAIKHGFISLGDFTSFHREL